MTTTTVATTIALFAALLLLPFNRPPSNAGAGTSPSLPFCTPDPRPTPTSPRHHPAPPWTPPRPSLPFPPPPGSHLWPFFKSWVVATAAPPLRPGNNHFRAFCWTLLPTPLLACERQFWSKGRGSWWQPPAWVAEVLISSY
jgi:hypothetical protein